MTEPSGTAIVIIMCDLCHESLVLDHGSYRHVAQHPNDHEAIAVPIDARWRGLCDFCVLVRPTHLLPARDFSVRTEGGVHARAISHWGACDPCTALIWRNEWGALTRRAVTAWEQRHGQVATAVEWSNTRKLYRLLRQNVTGSLMKLPH